MPLPGGRQHHLTGGASVVEPIEEQNAVEIAREVARDAYSEIDDYEVSVEETDQEWRVRFQLPGAPDDGGSSHFAVWVERDTGEARLFRGR